jgi:hypothetical protein
MNIIKRLVSPIGTALATRYLTTQVPRYGFAFMSLFEQPKKPS